MKNGRGISLQATRQLLILWKRYCNKTSNDIEQKWEEIYENNFPIASFSKSMKLRLPKFLMPKLSYLMGWLVGDGCFDSSKNHQRLKISEKSKAQLEKVIKPIVEEIFDVDCLVRKDHGGYCARIFSKPVFRFFRNVLDMNVGMIPKIIECSDIINKRYFLIKL